MVQGRKLLIFSIVYAVEDSLLCLMASFVFRVSMGFMDLNPDEYVFSQDAHTPCAKAPTAHANAQCLSQEVPGLPHLLAQFLSSSNCSSSVPIVSAQS